MGHYSITRDGTVYVNTNPRGEARWTPLATYSKMGFPLPGTEEYKRLYMQTGRQVGKTRWVKSAPSVDEGSHWYTTKEEPMQQKITYECDSIKQMLLDKNESYGNSALDPVRIFSTADKIEQLRIRIDDKLSRLQRGVDYGDEDTILDLIGYLVLLRIALKEDQ